MDAINVEPEIQGGAPCFTGTRVPVDSLFDHLSGGIPLNEFLLDFPSVGREQAIAVIEHAKRLVLDEATHTADPAAAGR